MGQRLAKFMARTGVCSRRQAEEYIFEKRVTVNGEIVDTPAFNVNGDEVILFDGEKLAEIGDKNHFIRSGLNDLIGITLLDNTVEGKKGIKQALEERLDKLLRASKKNKKDP